MNDPKERTILEKLKELPPERVEEVEDFVDFLRTRDREREAVRAAMRAAEPAFTEVWENEDDAAYDRLCRLRQEDEGKRVCLLTLAVAADIR